MLGLIFNISVVSLIGIYLIKLWIETYKVEKELITKTFKQLKPKNINEDELNKLIKSCRMQAIVYVETTIVGCLLAILGYNSFNIIMQSNILRILFMVLSILTIGVCAVKLVKERKELKLARRELRRKLYRHSTIKERVHKDLQSGIFINKV